MARLGAWQPVLSGSGTDCNGLLVVQNSRGVAALANGGLLWSYVAPLNPAPNLRWSAYVMGFGGLCRPVRVGGLVVVRLETSAGRFELIAFDARSGVIRWRWHGLTEAEEPAGSPAVWRGTTVLVPVLRSNSKEQVSELSLVAIDGDSGRELYRLPLAVSRAPIESQACANWGLVQYRTLAAPTVVGDSAYVDTGLGMICAIDLQDECVRWARLYQRKFNDNGGGMRVSVSPVVGSRNVLFAPVDSRWILLVDLATGALVQRRTDLAWTSIGRCGPENVLVTTPSAMQVMSLAGMEVGKVVDKAHMLHVAALADGCVASANGELAVLNNQGEIVRSMKTPADVVPSCLDAEGHWWGWGGLDGRTWGRLDDTTARRPMHLSAVAAGTGPMLLPYRTEPYVATWVPAAEGSYRVCQSLLTRVNPDGTLRWEVPLSWDSTAMACGKRVAVSMCGRVWTLDDASGSICSVWPPLMGASNEVAVARVTTRGPSLYASTVLTPGRMRIWDLGVEGRETAVPMMDLTAWPPGNDFWVTTVATQTFVVTHTPDDRDVFLFRANRLETPRTAPVVEAVQDIHWGGTANATIWYDSMRRNAIIFGRSPAETVRFNSNDGVQRHAIQGVADLWDGTATPLGDLMVFRYQHDAFDRVTDPESGSSVTLRELKDDKMERPLWEFSGVIGTEVFGMRSLATNQLMVFRQDLARGTVASDASQRAVLAGSVPEPADLWRGVVSLGDGRIMMLASSKSTYDELMRGYIWTPGSTDVKTVFLPGSKPPVQALSSNLWVCGDGLLTSADWARAAAPETQLLRVSWTNNYVSSDNFVADGFLDEWKDEEFLAIPQGRLAVRRPGGRSEVFRVAVDITNQAVAATVAANPDINAVCRIWAARSEAAGFNVLRPHMGLLSNEEVAQGLTRRCAWQVSPDGRHCTLELELAVGYVTVRNPGETPSVRAQQLGDIALRLSIDDPQLGVVDLVGNSRLGALGFVRLLLP